MFFLFGSCQKEQIKEPIQDQDPVFYISGTLGEENIDAHAGDGNFFMQTYTESVNGVKFFAGKLTDGNFEMELGIHDGNLDLAVSTPLVALANDINFAAQPTEAITILSKDLLPNSMLIQRIKWMINGALAGIDEVAITAPGKYNVCADVTFTDGTSSTLCNEIMIGYTKHATCQVRQFLSNNGNLQVWLEENQVPVYSVKWYLDNQFVGDQMKLYSVINNQSHTVKAEIVFENGTKRTQSIVVDGSLSGKFIDDFTVFEDNATSVSWDYKAQIEIKKDGREYTSVLAPNESSTLEITDIEYFGKNSAGKPVFKLSCNINCMMLELSTSKLVPLNCSTVFGVEIN